MVLHYSPKAEFKYLLTDFYRKMANESYFDLQKDDWIDSCMHYRILWLFIYFTKTWYYQVF